MDTASAITGVERLHSRGRTRAELVAEADDLHVSIARQQAALLELLAEIDRRELWRDSGYKDTATFVAARYGITHYAASRRVACSHAIKRLPTTLRALTTGELSLEKVVELTRMASPEDEKKLVAWARGVSPSRIRARADAALKPDIEAVNDVHAQRNVRFWYEDGGYRFCLAAELTADAGAIVAKALDRVATSLPESAEHDDAWELVDARRADALVALASARLGAETDGNRATVVVRTALEDLAAARSGGGHALLEGGGPIHPDTAARLLCDGRLRVVLDEGGRTVGIGYTSRVVPSWLADEVKAIHGCCGFPGCHSKSFLQCHHAVPWPEGPTDLTNLLPLCAFHHRLVHEAGWRVRIRAQGIAEWSLPTGKLFSPGPSPPRAG